MPECRLLVRFRGGEKDAVYLPDEGDLLSPDCCGSGWGCGSFGSVCGRLQWKYKGNFFPGVRNEGGRGDPALRGNYLRAASDVLPRSAVPCFARGDGAESLTGCLIEKNRDCCKTIVPQQSLFCFPGHIMRAAVGRPPEKLLCSLAAAAVVAATVTAAAAAVVVAAVVAAAVAATAAAVAVVVSAAAEEQDEDEDDDPGVAAAVT